MNTFNTIMKYVLYALGILVGLPILAWIIVTCLSIGLVNPVIGVCITLLIIIILGICIVIYIAKNGTSKKLKEENEQLKKKVEELERRLHIEKIVKESDAKRGH